MPRKSAEQLLEEQERALIGQAIAETEQEIFDDALSLDPDDNDGDRSLEEMDGEDVLDEDDVEGEEDDEGEDETDSAEADPGEEGAEGDEERTPATRHEPADRRQDARVPPARLREEAEGRRAAEARERELQSKLDQALGRLEALERGQRQQPAAQRQEQPQTEGPDMFADPEGWAAHQRETIAREMNERRINDSFASAIDDLGRETVDAAVAALAQTRNPALVSEILNSHNPGKVVVRWHERQQAMAEIGEDPAAYRQRVRDELLQDPEVQRAVITGARTNAMRGDRGTPRTQTRLPPSLNSATGGTSHRAGITAPRSRSSGYSAADEREIAESVWDD